MFFFLIPKLCLPLRRLSDKNTAKSETKRLRQLVYAGPTRNKRIYTVCPNIIYYKFKTNFSALNSARFPIYLLRYFKVYLKAASSMTKIFIRLLSDSQVKRQTKRTLLIFAEFASHFFSLLLLSHS